MLTRLTWTAVATACFLASPVAAADLHVQPSEVVLTGPQASQRLLVVAVEGDVIVGDHTAQAKFVSSNPAVATVDAAGVVRAAGDGTATITGTHEGKQATATVKVGKFKEPFTWSFR